MTHFLTEGDAALKRVNGDYDAKRDCYAHDRGEVSAARHFQRMAEGQGKARRAAQGPPLEQRPKIHRDILSMSV
jgi:hypothetical protein